MTKLTYKRGSVRRGEGFEVLVDIHYDAAWDDKVVVAKNEWDIEALYLLAKQKLDERPDDLDQRKEFEEMRLAFGEMVTLKRREHLPMAHRDLKDDGRSEVVWKYEYPESF